MRRNSKPIGLSKLKHPRRRVIPPATVIYAASVPSNVDISGDLESPVTGGGSSSTKKTSSSSSTSVPVPGTSRSSAPVPPGSGDEGNFKVPPPKQRKRSRGRTSERAEQLLSEDFPSDILNSRRPATKVRFIPKKSASGEEKPSEEFDLDHPGVKESLEICQGFSKIKLEDWYPFFDFQYNARHGPSAEPKAATPEVGSTSTAVDEDDGGEDDEWEETLVYVDLEDIPHAEGLFASLTPPPGGEANGEMGEEASGGAALSHIEMKIFNMESQLPVLLLGGKYLPGQWQDTMGTSLFFKKKSEQPSSSPTPHSSSASPPNGNLKNIVPEPEIPFDPLFGDSYTSKEEEGYELVAKSFKVLKAKHVPVVNEDQNREDFIRDNDDEFDHRDFQIPPVNMIRQFTTVKDLNYDKYIEEDINRRREIHNKWKSKGTDDSGRPPIMVKSEPVEQNYSEDDGFLIEDDDDSSEPIPGPSNVHT